VNIGEDGEFGHGGSLLENEKGLTGFRDVMTNRVQEYPKKSL
jgi:hypothetical protein